MKIPFNSFLLAAASVLILLHDEIVSSSSPQNYNNRMECVTDHDEIMNADFFPHKVQPANSEFWNVSYHGTYKILTNKASNLTYLLYQCGTGPPPTSIIEEEQQFANILSIPPANGIVISSTPMIAYLELLGLRTDVRGFLGSESLISSPCLLDLIDSGSVGVVAPDAYGGGANETVLAQMGLLRDDMVTLVNGYWTGGIFASNNTVVMEEYQESSFAGTMEWIKAYGAIFNREAQANQIYDQANCRFDAVAENVATVTSDNKMPAGETTTTPKVLWAYYSDYCGGWDVAECPNYYCDFAKVCHAEVLNSTQGSVLETCGAPYMTNDEFVAFGKDADHWIYPSVNWNSISAQFVDILAEFRSVQMETVYDYQGAGENAWFEQRFAEYDVVLNDFCLVAGTAVSTSPANRRMWLRNVFKEPVGTLERCEDPAAPYVPRGNLWSNCGNDNGKNNEGNAADGDDGVEDTRHEQEDGTESETEEGETSAAGSQKYASVGVTLFLWRSTMLGVFAFFSANLYGPS